MKRAIGGAVLLLSTTAHAEDAAPGAPPPSARRSLHLTLDGGAATQRLENIGFYGGELGLGLFATTPRLSLGPSLRVFGGETEHGLAAKAIRGTYLVGVRVGRFAFAADAGLVFLVVSRVTRDRAMVGWGPKLGASARFDMWEADGLSLYARVGGDAGAAVSDGSFVGAVTLGAGIDFDVAR